MLEHPQDKLSWFTALIMWLWLADCSVQGRQKQINKRVETWVKILLFLSFWSDAFYSLSGFFFILVVSSSYCTSCRDCFRYGTMFIHQMHRNRLQTASDFWPYSNRALVTKNHVRFKNGVNMSEYGAFAIKTHEDPDSISQWLFSCPQCQQQMLSAFQLFPETARQQPTCAAFPFNPPPLSPNLWRLCALNT